VMRLEETLSCLISNADTGDSSIITLTGSTDG
jgi:hypothetical protein